MDYVPTTMRDHLDFRLTKKKKVRTISNVCHSDRRNSSQFACQVNVIHFPINSSYSFAALCMIARFLYFTVSDLFPQICIYMCCKSIFSGREIRVSKWKEQRTLSLFDCVVCYWLVFRWIAKKSCPLHLWYQIAWVHKETVMCSQQRYPIRTEKKDPK